MIMDLGLSANTSYLLVVEGTTTASNLYIYNDNGLDDQISTGFGTYVFTTPGSGGYSYIYFRNIGSGTTDITTIEVKELDHFIQPSEYINAATIPADPAIEEEGAVIQNTTVLNLLPYSEDFSEWSSAGIVEMGALSPTGDYNAGTMTVDGASTWVRDAAIPVNESSTYTFSVFVKNISLTEFGLRAYNVSGSAQIAYSSRFSSINTESFTRVSLTFDTPAGCTSVYIYPGYAMAPDTGQAIIYGANLTETPVLYEYIPSFGTPVWTSARSLTWESMPDKFKDIFDDSGTYGGTTSAGTILVWLDLGFAHTDLSGDTPILSLNSGAEFLYVDNAGRVETTDGTNTANIDIDFASGDSLIVAITWDKTGDSIRIGAEESGSWTWDSSSAAFDDKWALGSDLLVGDSNTYPFNIKRIYFYPRALSTDAIEQNF